MGQGADTGGAPVAHRAAQLTGTGKILTEHGEGGTRVPESEASPAGGDVVRLALLRLRAVLCREFGFPEQSQIATLAWVRIDDSPPDESVALPDDRP